MVIQHNAATTTIIHLFIWNLKHAVSVPFLCKFKLKTLLSENYHRPGQKPCYAWKLIKEYLMIMSCILHHGFQHHCFIATDMQTVVSTVAATSNLTLSSTPFHTAHCLISQQDPLITTQLMDSTWPWTTYLF